MTFLVTLLGWLISNPTIVAIVAGVVGALGWGWKQRRAGAASERAKRDAADRRVNDVADDIQNDVRAMSPEQVDAELRKRAKR